MGMVNDGVHSQVLVPESVKSHHDRLFEQWSLANA